MKKCEEISVGSNSVRSSVFFGESSGSSNFDFCFRTLLKTCTNIILSTYVAIARFGVRIRGFKGWKVRCSVGGETECSKSSNFECSGSTQR